MDVDLAVMPVDAHSYAVATRVGPRPRHVRHVQEDANPNAMCGAGPVRYVGEVGQANDERWPWCPRCVELCEAMDDFWWWNADVFARG